MCMTLSGHTSTLPRLVGQGRVFEGSLLQSGFGKKSTHFYTTMTEGVSFCIEKTQGTLENEGGEGSCAVSC